MTTTEVWMTRTLKDPQEPREWQVRLNTLYCRRRLPKGGYSDWQVHTTIPVRLRREINDLFERPNERVA